LPWHSHLYVHVAAALDANGGVLGVESFPTTTAGIGDLSQWLGSFGTLKRVGVEGTGAYGAGLARHLRSLNVAVLEVDQPNRQLRRSKGKSDELDAVEAAGPWCQVEPAGSPRAPTATPRPCG
jgi:transposase